MSPTSTSDGDTLTGYRCVGDVSFDLDGTVLTDIGWVLFEVASSQSHAVRGIIGTYNHHATLQLLRLDRAERPCRIRGEFEDGITEARAWALDDVVFTAVDVDDTGGVIALRAVASSH
ncbi:MAG: hypothetical protein ACXVIR_12025 [Halobacteriota archaeon]